MTRYATLLPRRAPRALLYLAALALLSPAAQATFTTYTSQAAFLAAIGGASFARTDSFDDLAAGALPSPTTRTAGGVSYQVTGSQGTGSTAGLRVLGAGGGDSWLSTLNSAANLGAASFSTPVYAVGANFFVTDAAGAVVPNISTLFGVSDNVGAFGSASVINATAASFVGIVSTRPITSVSFGLSSLTYATVNNLVLSTGVAAVPEPGSWGLMLGGAAALALWRRARKAPGN